MNARVTVIPVRAIGTSKGVAFVHRADGCGLEEIETESYPKSQLGQSLREARLDTNMTLGEFARHFGIGPAEASGLEWGRYDLSESDWQFVFGELAAVRADRRLAQ